MARLGRSYSSRTIVLPKRKEAAPSGSTTNQSLDATSTTTASFGSTIVGKLITTSGAAVVTFVKLVGKITTLSSTSTVSFVKGVGKVLNASATSTATLIYTNLVLKALSVVSTVIVNATGPGPFGTNTLDDFNRANGALGSNWTGNPRGAGGYVAATIVSNEAVGATPFDISEEYWNANTFNGGRVEAWGEVGSTSSDIIDAFIWTDVATSKGYFLQFYLTSYMFGMYESPTSGSNTGTTAIPGGQLNTGDKFALVIDEQGLSGWIDRGSGWVMFDRPEFDVLYPPTGTTHIGFLASGGHLNSFGGGAFKVGITKRVQKATATTASSIATHLKKVRKGLGSGSAPYKNLIKSASPVVYWPLDETSGTTASDYVGTSNGTYTVDGAATLTLGDTPLITTGTSIRSQWGIDFSETAYVVAPGSLESALASLTDASVEGWFSVDPTAVSTEGTLFKGALNVNLEGSIIHVNVTDDTPQLNSINYTIPGYTQGDTVYVALVWQNSRASLYVNGNFAGTTDPSGVAAIYSTPMSTGVGAFQYTPSDINYDEVAWYGRALSEDEIQEHYRAGLGLFQSNVNTSTVAPSFVKRVGKILSNTVTAVVTLATSFISGSTTFNQSLDITVASTTTLVKQVGKNISVSAANAVSLVKRAGKNLSVTVAETVSNVKRAGVNRTITEGSTVSFTKRVGKIVQVNAATVTTLIKSVTKPLASISVASTVTLVKRVGKNITTSSAVTATLTTLSSFVRALTVGATATVTFIKSPRKAITVASASTVTLLKQAQKLINQSVSNTTTFVKQVGKNLTLSVTGSPTLLAGLVFVKNLTVTVVSVVTLNAQKLSVVINQALNVTVTSSVSLIKQAQKILSTTVSNTPSFVRSARTNISATVSGIVATITKRVSKTVSTSTVGVVTLATAATLRRTLTAVASNTTTFIKRVNKTVSTTVGNTATAIRQAGISRSVSSAVNSTLVKSIGLTIQANVVSIASFARSVGKNLTAAVTGSVLLNTARMITLTAVVNTVSTLIATRGTVAIILTVAVNSTATILAAAFSLIQNIRTKAFGNHENTRGRGGAMGGKARTRGNRRTSGGGRGTRGVGQ